MIQGHSQDQEVSWSGEIACLIYSHCSSCHNPGGIAPFSLLNYQEVYDYRFSIVDVIERKYMPPWPADPSYRHFQQENVLSDEEIEMFKDWVAQDAPKGDVSQAPNPPSYDRGPVIEDPDLVLELPVYKVPALSDNDLYRCFAFDIDLPADAFITAFEVIPGNPAIVHHALIYESTNPQIDILDAADPEPGYTCFGGIGVADVTGIGGWVPGSEAHYFPEGMGMKIPSKTKIVVQVHYPEYGAGEIDSSKVLFKLSYDNERNISSAPVLNHTVLSLTNGPLFIPANTVKEFRNLFVVPVPVTIYSVTPHAHLICEAMRSFGVTPSGDTIKFVDIPHWDFDWQKTYNFRHPILLPAGTIMHGYARYNNTSSNDHNPNIPPKDVGVGEATTDEMMLFYFTWSETEKGDEDIVFEEDGHYQHHENCEYDLNTFLSHTNQIGDIQIYPNPASCKLQILSEKRIDKLVAINAFGVPVLEDRNVGPQYKIDVSGWPSGVYWIKTNLGQISEFNKIVVGQ